MACRTELNERYAIASEIDTNVTLMKMACSYRPQNKKVNLPNCKTVRFAGEERMNNLPIATVSSVTWDDPEFLS